MRGLIARADRQVLEVNGTRVEVILCGSGEPLLLLNGIGAHVGTWEPLVRELAATRQLVMFDAPGVGATATLQRAPRMRGVALFVAHVLDELSLGEVDVLGISWGGALAQQLAHNHPSRVRKLVLVATHSGLLARPPSLKASAAMFTPRRFTSREHARAVAGRLYGGDYRNGVKPESVLHQWVENPPTLTGYAHQLYAITGWTSITWLPRLRQPTLVIAGDDDPLVPLVNAKILAGLIPGATLTTIRNGGHLWALDHADESGPMIEAFLSG